MPYRKKTKITQDPNKFLRIGQSRLILLAQVKASRVKRMIKDKETNLIWSAALSAFHRACEAYRIEMRMQRIPRKLHASKLRLLRLPKVIDTPKIKVELQVFECEKCGVICFNSKRCNKHDRG